MAGPLHWLMNHRLFGYDQGVMGGLLTLSSFVKTFPEIDTTDATEMAQHLNASQKTHRSTIQGTMALYANHHSSSRLTRGQVSRLLLTTSDVSLALLLRSLLETALVAERPFFSALRSWLLVQLCSVHHFRWLSSSLEDWSQGTSYDPIKEKEC